MHDTYPHPPSLAMLLYVPVDSGKEITGGVV